MDLNSNFEQLSNKQFNNYEVIDVCKLTDINSVGLLLKHKKSGARVAVVSNDDENKVFSIGFKTPPDNDTGLQHILEHSTLCGSRKYPVKDPFVELCKGSLNTFLNAMTYPDKTVYPVASCNDVDFKNIMDVYMDAVFYPNIYERPEIFRQEGWHYELENVDDDIKYNGVVFNEMKGVYSSPDDVLSRYVFVSLFPDSVYKYESGGDPEVIPQLEYEKFLQYHKEYYHPSNSYIYLYGDIDVEERLRYLDEEYLKDFDKNEINVNPEIPVQKAFSEVKSASSGYAITEDESLEDNTYLSYNIVVGTSLDKELYLAMQILDYALILAPGAPLKQALIDASIGTDVYSSFETSVYQPVYSIIAKNANENQKDEFIKIIKETLSGLVKNGINRRTIQAGINYYEFKYREADYGPYPKGLMYYLTMMDSWLYDDTKPFIHIEALDTFKSIKEKVQSGLFEDIIQKYLLDNTHAVVYSLIPEYGLEEKKALKEAEILKEYKASLSEEQLKELVNQTKELKKYQDEPSSQEDLKSIPMLKLKDIDDKPMPLNNEPKTVNDITVVHHNMFTGGIAYTMLAFDCKNVPDDMLGYIGLLSSVLGLMDTDNYTYPELTNEININSGGISTDAAIYTDSKDAGKFTIMYEVKGKSLYEKCDFVQAMMKEIMYHTKFYDYKRLKEIIARIKSRLEATMTSQGHSVALLDGMAQFSQTAYYSNIMRGYGFYKLIKELSDNFDDIKEEISDKLKKLTELIFTKDNLKVSFTADDAGYDSFETSFKKFSADIPDVKLPVSKREYTPFNEKTGYATSSQVQYVAMCGNFLKDGYSYTGALKVLKVIFSYEYLWINVRVKGGAYGCMSGFGRNGDSYMVSYRDPNLSKTIEIFKNAPEYIRNFNVSDRDMVKFIIGTIGEMDTPMNPSAKGIRSFGAYISNTDYELLKKERKEVLEADVQSIRALAPLVESAMKQDYLCVIGNQKVIQDESSLFDTVKTLIL
ncbi:MAG: insulinase family protein [Lachnospira sp.]|nr:insulinase family protein [Lachnospira sp.]